ncbi:MAG: hypothetical protein ACRDND_22080, partial [Streptosporangiaceae bacterium]
MGGAVTAAAFPGWCGRRPAQALIAAICAVLLAACSTSGTSHPAASAPASTASPSPQDSSPVAGPPPTTLAGYYAQKLHWQAC